MTKNAAAENYLSTKALCFSVPVICLWSMLPADAASLCYNFNVNISESGLSHKVQGQLDKKAFITCESNNCHAIGGLGETLKTTQHWKTQVETLKDGIDRVIDQALFMKQIDQTREPFTVQVMISCSHGANGNTNASCDLSLNEHKVLHLHPSTGEWIQADRGSMQIEEMWKKNKDLEVFLYRTSQGDCKAWLKEMIKLLLEEKLEPTGLVKVTAGIVTSASPTIAPDVDKNSSMTMKPNAFVLLFALALLVLLLSAMTGWTYSREVMSVHLVPPLSRPSASTR